ncbi:hypothetical protein [Pedobacter sp. FW305-3-2-15-E-R2A2]|jgi:hypothetical protein|uniref:hypothetical protein n=1 Tax=Pedobacter sp. FW305-3-2-15-E-R2A2 TaxID=3140251 RepID=UPI00313FEA16
MRVVVFFVFLFSHLLCRGNDIHAGTAHHSMPPVSHCSHHRLAKSEPTNFATADLDLTVSEEGDLDEEHTNGDDLQHGLTHSNYLLCDKWYLSFFPALILEDYHQHFKTFPPFCGDTSPIYIKQRVLRI